MALHAALSPRHSPRSDRLLVPVVMTALFVGSLLQRPGSTTFDTKLDLVMDPTAFLVNALQPWTPQMNLGSLQNQASGYLFPIGPFFVLGDALHVPDWLWQRAWSGLVLVVAFEGARRLHRALSPSVPTGLWLVTGLAYALAPRTLGLVGVLSAEALPAAVLPWVALPLVHAVSGRYSPARAAGVSGFAFLFVGGVNATAAVAILPLPAMLILCGRVPGSRLRLGAWWSAAVLAASAVVAAALADPRTVQPAIPRRYRVCSRDDEPLGVVQYRSGTGPLGVLHCRRWTPLVDRRILLSDLAAADRCNGPGRGGLVRWPPAPPHARPASPCRDRAPRGVLDGSRSSLGPGQPC